VFQHTPAVVFTGTAEPLTTVLVEEDGQLRGSTVAGLGGQWALDISAVADGAHAYRVRARDDAGNLSAAVTLQVTVDTLAPETAIDSGPSGPTSDPSPRFAFGSSEPGGSFECRLDGPGAAAGEYARCSSPHSLSSLADGAYTLHVRAFDAAGNADPTPATRTFAVDATPPDAPEITSPADGSSQRTTTVTLTGRAEVSATILVDEDGTARGSVQADGTGAWSLEIAPVAEGPHTFSARARDAVGNLSAARDVRVTIDAGEPQTTITGGADGLTASASASFAFTASRPGASFECRLDGPGTAIGAFAPCGSPKSYAGLTDGMYTFRVRATDVAGNTDGTPATRAFTVDTTAADTAIASGPSGPTNHASPAFTFSSPEPGVSYECRLDGPGGAGTYGACTSPVTLGPLADDGFVLRVRSIDPAGNRDATPATRTFVIDTVAPDTAIDTGPSGVTGEASASFGFASGEAGTRFECRLDGPSGDSGFVACRSPQLYSGLAAGDYAFAVRSADAAGNLDATPSRRRFTVRAPEPKPVPRSQPAGTPAAAASPTPLAAPSPAFGKWVVARAVRGEVVVRRRGAKTSVPLTVPTAVGAGWTIDATEGKVALTALDKAGGRLRTATLGGGVVTLGRVGTTTELRLSAKLTCASASSAKRAERRVAVSGGGRLKVRGRYSTASSRSGSWTIRDACAATTTRVTKGTVDVVARGGKRKRLRAGGRYVARATR
jgi:hypothetical protein